MKTLYVYADFDWLDEPMQVGELGYESLRGSDSYSFKYDNDWLRQDCQTDKSEFSRIYNETFRHKILVGVPLPCCCVFILLR